MTVVTPQYLQADASKPDFHEVPQLAIDYITLNQGKDSACKPVTCAPINDIHFRLAMMYAIDRTTINSKILHGARSISVASCPRVSTATARISASLTPYDPAKAKAGAGPGQEGLRWHAAERWQADADLSDQRPGHRQRVHRNPERVGRGRHQRPDQGRAIQRVGDPGHRAYHRRRFWRMPGSTTIRMRRTSPITCSASTAPTTSATSITPPSRN